METIQESESASSFRIRNPFADYNSVFVKYPSLLKASQSKKTFHRGDFTSVLKLSEMLGSDESAGKSYYWGGFSVFIDMYQSYLYRKYRVNCQLEQQEFNKLYFQLTKKTRLFSVVLFIYSTTIDSKSIKKLMELQADSISNCIISQFDDKSWTNTLKLKTPQKSSSKQKNKILPLSTVLALPGNKFHSNCMIYRKDKNIVEIFEPHGAFFRDGSLQTEINHQYKVLIDYVNIKLKEKGFTTIFEPVYAENNCPDINGIQKLESVFAQKSNMKKSTEGVGYCALWALFIQELALLNPDMTLESIVQNVLKQKTKKELGKYMFQIARGYSEFVSSKLEKYFTTVLGTKANVKNIIKSKNNFNKAMEQHNYYLMVEYDLFERKVSMKTLKAMYNEQLNSGNTDNNYLTKMKLNMLERMMKIKAITPLTRKKNKKSKVQFIDLTKDNANAQTRKTNIIPQQPVIDLTQDDAIVVSETRPEDVYTMPENASRCKAGYVRFPKGSRTCKSKQKPKNGTQKQRTPFRQTRVAQVLNFNKVAESSNVLYKKEGQKRCPKGYNVDKKDKLKCLKKVK